MIMREGREFRPDINNADSGREVSQVTHRGYELYFYNLLLPEDCLAEAETVVDIGSGFSDFSKKAREKFEGLHAIAVDPVYKYMKSDHQPTPEGLVREDGVFLDFNPEYRDEQSDPRLYERKRKEIFDDFVKEINQHPNEYVGASHQDLPFEDNSADLVLACNSVMRSENKPLVIQRALEECSRILKKDGEIRIGGAITCFVFNPSNNNVELHFNGTLFPDSPQAEELDKTGHTTDPELMKAFVDLEKAGINFHCIVVSAERDGEMHHRFNTLILRKDEAEPAVKLPESEPVEGKLMKLHFQETDGFNVPSTLESQF